MRGQRPQPPDRRMQRSLARANKRRPAWMFIAVLAILLIVGGIGGYGYYHEYVAPTKVLAVRVGDVTHTQGDVVDRIRIRQAAALALGQQLDYGREPFEVIRDIMQAEVIRRQGAAAYNIRVTEEDVEAELKARFYPNPPPGQDVAPGQLDREYRESYLDFLNRSHVSNSEYVQLIEEDIFETRLREELSVRVPSTTEQVEIRWVILPSLIDLNAPTNPGSTPNEIRDRLRTEDFATVAGEVSADRTYADRNGYVGWVPEDAFPSLDPYLFGDDTQDPLAVGEISEPIHSISAIRIVQVLSGLELQPIPELMREKLKDRALERWLLDQQALGTGEGWLELNNTSKLYSWVTDQVRQSAPRVTPPAAQ